MPLLDRTAAGLEPSGLQRLLPKVSKAGSTGNKPSGALQALFAQKGLSGPDLPLPHSPPPSPRDGYFDMYTPDLPPIEPMHASAFLLDFLYPKGALNFARKLSSSAKDRKSRPNSISSTNSTHPTHPTHSLRSPRRPTRQFQSLLSSQAAAPGAQRESSSPEMTHIENTQALPEEQGDVLENLVQLLQTNPMATNHDAFERAWNLYQALENRPQKTELVLTVIQFISPSRRPTEAHHILRLFGGLDLAAWNAATVTCAIRAQIILNKQAEALSIFQRSTDTGAWANGAAPGLDLLLATAFKTYSWDVISSVWNVYKKKTERNKAEADLLKAVLLLPDLQGRMQFFFDHINKLEEEMAENEASQETEQPEQAEPAVLAELDLTEPGSSDVSQGQDLESLKEVFKAFLEASLSHLDPEVAFPFVRSLTNPRVLENFIQVLVNNKRNDLAARAYSEYRVMPKFQPHTATLTTMVRDVYYPTNPRGMEDVLKDWYKSKTRPNFWGYQKYLAFYASRGDVTSVHRLWSEFTTVYPTAIQSAEDTFAHLLKAHAVRGDLAQVEQVFAEISDKYGLKPNIICWNIRLHVFVESGRYTEAMQVFEDLCEAVEPDAYSFSTIMTIVGGRGDLELVSDLYWLAQQCGVQINESIIDPIVEAYCQNDRYDEAERLCVTTTREGKIGGKPYTALWNTLLHHHALRHDLVAVNRILNVMTRLHVKYDNGTYSALLFALAQCRQPRRAVELLRAAQEDGIFRPSAHHYTLLMMAYIRSKQPHRALQVNRLMHHMGFQRSSQQIQLVIKAFSQWQDFPKGDGTQPAEGGMSGADRRDLFAKALREFQRSLSVQDRDRGSSRINKEFGGRDSARMHLGAVRRFSFVIFMLVQARDFAGVEEVMQLYKSIAPADERQQPLPLKLCNALMLSDYYEGRYDRVKEMWQNILGRTQEISRSQTLKDTRLESILGITKADGVQTDIQADIQAAIAADELTPEGTTEFPTTADPLSPSKTNPFTTTTAPKEADPRVVAKLRYGLTDPLKTMQRLYASERDADGLISLVNEDVLGNGFLLDSKNWNHYVQNLARLGRTREAFSVCETRLMAQWSGFTSLRGRGRGADEEAGRSDSRERPSRSKSPSRTNSRSQAGTSDSEDRASGVPRLSRLQQIRESATRYNRPMNYTFMVLAKAYLELEQMAVWSSAAERQFQELSLKFPQTVWAVRTMVRMNSRIEGRVFGGGDNVVTDLGIFPENEK